MRALRRDGEPDADLHARLTDAKVARARALWERGEAPAAVTLLDAALAEGIARFGRKDWSRIGPGPRARATALAVAGRDADSRAAFRDAKEAWKEYDEEEDHRRAVRREPRVRDPFRSAWLQERMRTAVDDLGPARARRRAPSPRARRWRRWCSTSTQ